MNKKNKTKQIFRIFLLLGTLVSLYFVPWPIVSAWMTPLPNQIQQQVNQAADYGFDGIIVCVNTGKNQNTIYTSGYHNKEEKIPAKPDALFKIASVSKLYNAVAITKLVSSGKISLNRSLAFYLPELANRIENANKINIRMLVQHRSGIPNFTDTYMYWANPKETAQENLNLILDQPADFKPDEDYAYSNTNYLLLDMIMQRVLGYDTFHYIEDEILKPLDLYHTYASLEKVNLDNVMSGYYVGYEGDLKSDKVHSILATAEDLSHFIRALNDGSIFSNTKEKELYNSLYKYEHTGLIPGYQTIAKYHKELDVVVVQFTNTVDFEGYNWSLSEIMYSRIIKILRTNTE
jgi:CubicO group peptidase (beta-lactamase class C family)